MTVKEMLRETVLEVLERHESLCMDNHEERKKLTEALVDKVREKFRVFPSFPKTKE